MTPGNKHHDINCYALLGIARGSSIQVIKTAYRKMSMETHPDRGGSNEAQARINYAYEILSDPVRRRRHDEVLSSMTVHATVKQRNRSQYAGDWENNLRKKKAVKSFKERVREEMDKKSEEIKSGYSHMVDAVYADACRDFKKIRGRCIISATAGCVFAAFGFVYPVLWAGVVLSGYAMVRYARYGSGDDAVFVLNPEWKYTLKKCARKKAAIESDAQRAHLDDISDCVARLFKALRKMSGIKDDEATVLRRILMHFFLLGFAPVSHDKDARIAVLSDGDEKIAVRYRHRTGIPVNAAYIETLYDYMIESNIQKGFLFAAPGISGNAAKLARKHAIAHYSIREMNAWISRITSGRYSGPRGDIIDHIDALMKFMQLI